MDDPVFFIDRKFNEFSRCHGPVLTYPDGRLVPGQTDTRLEYPAGGIIHVTVSFHVIPDGPVQLRWREVNDGD